MPESSNRTLHLEVASKVDAKFVRFDVFVDNVKIKWGKISAQARELVVLKLANLLTLTKPKN